MGYIKVAKIKDIKEGKVLTVHAKFGRIGLTKIGKEIFAFQDRCTHDDGPLSGGTISKEVISCPRHGACFNLKSGRVLKMPATEDIETYPVKITGEDLEIDPG